MRINQNCKVREIAGENVVIMQGQQGVDMTRVVALNDSSLLLWNNLLEVDFSIDDVKRLREMDIHGAIIGKAYYIGAIDLKKAIEVAK